MIPKRLVVWAHGGGFAGGDLDMAESHVVAAEVAYRADALVVTVAYRLADGHTRYPAPVDDVQTVWHWARGLVEAFTPALLGGASAGGTIALSSALRERGTSSAPHGLLLAYPFVHFPVPAVGAALLEEMKAVPRMMRFDAAEIERMAELYVGRIVDLPPGAFPGGGNLDGLPPVFVVIDEYDDLRPSAELLVTQLGESAVPATRYLARGMTHGHLNRTPALAEVDATLTAMARFIRLFQ